MTETKTNKPRLGSGAAPPKHKRLDEQEATAPTRPSRPAARRKKGMR